MAQAGRVVLARLELADELHDLVLPLSGHLVAREDHFDPLPRLVLLQFGAHEELEVLREVSKNVEELLMEYGASIVTAARGFAKEVIFIPVTATGRSPIVAGSDANGRVDLRFDPSQIFPRWVELPVLYALYHAGLRSGDEAFIPAENAAKPPITIREPVS